MTHTIGLPGSPPESALMPIWKKKRAKEMRDNPTEAEARLWRFLRWKSRLEVAFRRQIALYGYIADFYCREIKLIVEVDGPIHKAKYDQRRDRLLACRGIKTLRFTNKRVLKGMPLVAQEIRKEIRCRLTRQSASNSE